MARYALFSAQYLPHIGGVEMFTHHLAHGLVKFGHEVTIVTSACKGQPPQSTEPDGVNVLRLPSYSLMEGRLPISRVGLVLRDQMRMLSTLGIERALINARFYTHSIVALHFAKKSGADAIVLDHGSTYLTLGGGPADYVLHAYEHVMTAVGKAYYPKYAGISHASAKWLEQFGISTQTVIPNAIDAPLFRRQASSADFRQKLGVRRGQKLVVSVGRLTPEKGSRQLVRATRMFGDLIHLAIAGEGPLRAELEADLPNNVSLLGNLSHEELSALLRDADLFCLPTRSEGFCTSLLEAGAWGLMPLITHVGGTDEVMGNPIRFGSLLDSMDSRVIAKSIETMLQTGKLGHSEELMQHVEEHCGWDNTVKALDQAFESL